MTIEEWNRAAETDTTLQLSNGITEKLSRFELRPCRYSRNTLFSSMIRQEPVIFNNFPLRYTMQPFFEKGNLTVILKDLFKHAPKTLTRIGKAKYVRYLPVQEVVDKWQQGNTVLSANDVFFRTLRLDKVFDCASISDFNIIPGTPPGINYIEVATLLMGTPGCFTDSHSDDPDGSNYCIRGKKLWFVWDRQEGRKYGLEDCEYDEVYTQAKFDLKAFMKMHSAKWFTIGEGQTLFLPGNFTHKVITLEQYLGISSFYFGLPNALCSLSRWKFNGTVMVNEKIQQELIKILLLQLEKTATGNRAYKQQWGFYHLGEAITTWRKKYTKAKQKTLCADPLFNTLLDKFTLYSH